MTKEFCPKCGAVAITFTRGIPSMATCENGHEWERKTVTEPHPQSVQPANPSKPDEFWQDDTPDTQNPTDQAFLECIDLLRSALSIAGRKGKNTNWVTFGLRLSQTLTKLHPLYNKIKGKNTP